MKKTIYFITSNKGKALEAKEKFSSININVVQKNLGYHEIQADFLEDVAFYGAEDVKKRFKKPFFLEDAGLFVDALNGFPGVYSAYVYYTIGCNGILKLLEGLDDEKRKACFKSVIAYGQPSKKPLIFTGKCYGRISKKTQGTRGFGFDPIFIPDGEKKTFAEMETNEKNRFSHRGKSLEKLINFFINHK
ncbi:MAG: XTP/dITP diphosphatase [Candidatus Thermoplasmatota archaeon]|jgi:XTP/dITP diphosphohydrolase|nr:XTP/dITP diphosphatase [Candidatus Thermoplasmatota archaeon]